MSENKPLDSMEELNYLVNLSYRALKINPTCFIQSTVIPYKDLIRPDFLLPIIVAMTNTLGRTLLDGPKGQKAFTSILPFDVYKETENLCFLALREIPNSTASKTLKLLLLMEVQHSLFVATRNKKDNTVDFTDLVNGWRDTLSSTPEGRIISPDKIALKLIQQNMKILSSTTTNILKTSNN